MRKNPAKMKHNYTAKVKLVAGLPPAFAKTGEGWTIKMDDQGEFVDLRFEADCAITALNKLHRLMQRTARGEKPPNAKGARPRYGRFDYLVVELRHPGTGVYDLPETENPDMRPRTPAAISEQDLALRRRHGLVADPRWQ